MNLASAPGSVSGRPAIPAGLKLPLRFLSADGANPGRAIFGGRSGTTVADLAGPRVIVVMENPYFGLKRYAWEVRIQVFVADLAGDAGLSQQVLEQPNLGAVGRRE